MTPRIEESGGKRKRTRMSKFGNASVRRSLYMAAVVNARYNKTDVAAWYHEAVGRGMNPVKALVRVMRKILDRMHLMITTTRAYEPFPRAAPPARVEGV